MKKTLTILLASVVMLFAFAGCTSGGDSNSDSSNSSSNSAASFDLKAYVDTPYLTWNNDKWSAASDKEKVDCVLTYAAYKISVKGGSDADYAAVTNENMGDKFSEDLPVVTEIFKTMADKGYDTLKAAIDAGYEPVVDSSAS